MSTRRRVAITGLGLVTPVGNDVASTWSALLAGRSGAARIASFPPHAVAAAKASVLRAEHGVVADLQAEAAGFQGTLSGPGTRAAMERFLASGGQTPAGEARLGALCGELHAAPGAATPVGGAGPG